MSLQTIIDLAESVKINRRKVVGIQYTRSEILRTSETPTRNPWRFTVTVSAKLPYNESRILLENLDTLDKTTPEEITFSNNPGLEWVFKYRGQMTQGQINDLLIQKFGDATSSYSELVLQNLPQLPTNAVLFRAGDVIQPENYPYPFSIQEDVLRGTASTVTLKTHRPNFISDNLELNKVKVGNDVTFKLVCINMPTYTILPGQLVQFDSEFQLYEHTGNEV